MPNYLTNRSLFHIFLGSDNNISKMIMRLIWTITLVLVLPKLVLCDNESSSLPCSQKLVDGDTEAIVCVCNETYCDQVGTLDPPPKGHYTLYTSNKAGLRLNKSQGTFENYSYSKAPSPGLVSGLIDEIVVSDAEYRVKVVVSREDAEQTILGFGGAFTDAAGINIADLPESLRITLLRSYYGPEGIGYTMGRIPMGGCDFSTHTYTYDDQTGDDNLTSFALPDEDNEFKIPFLKEAKVLNPSLLLFASPWTAPPWMKTNNDYSGFGRLKEDYYQLWADYFVKFLESYKKEGVELWGVTTQNEPIDGLIPFFPFNSMGWTPSSQRDWIKNHLGPTLHKNGFDKVKIIILDDNTILLPFWAKKILSDPEASQYISGVGVHWYTNSVSGYSGVNSTRHMYPDKFILPTEACVGFFPWEKNVDLGSWYRGELYSEDIIQELLNGAVGWTDWNLALDHAGGPNWANLGADSPIIVNKTGKEFYKQPMFYALAHVSKFFTRDSKIISVETKQSSHFSKFFVVAAIRRDKLVTIAFLNRNDFEIDIDLWDPAEGTDSAHIKFTLTPRSFATLIY